MKVKFNQCRGNRIKKGTFKGFHKRRHIFGGLMANDHAYWHPTLNKWITEEEAFGVYYNDNWMAENLNIHSLKGAIRHINKHKHYLPKGTVFTLVSWFEGYDIDIIL